MAPDARKSFLDAALAEGYLTEAQAEDCRQALASAGAGATAEDVVVAGGYMTRDHADAVRAEMALASGERLTMGGLEILTKLGEGGMGKVYKARQINLDRVVAVKILPRKLSMDAVYIERFHREARAAAKLCHPNIVSGIDVGFASGHHYLVMEFVEGKSLDKILRAKGRLSEDEAVRIARQVALALAYAHENGVVHRDIKPGNIMVTRDGTAKLCDLGLARRDDRDEPSLVAPGTALGSPRYMSPEQARAGQVADGRSDIYSLGVTLFHMLTGARPFDGATATEVMRKHVSEPAPCARDVAPNLSPAVCRVVAKMLEKDPARRHQTGTELAAELEALLSAGRGPSAPTRSGADRAQGPPGVERAGPRPDGPPHEEGGNGPAPTRRSAVCPLWVAMMAAGVLAGVSVVTVAEFAAQNVEYESAACVLLDRGVDLYCSSRYDAAVAAFADLRDHFGEARAAVVCGSLLERAQTERAGEKVLGRARECVKRGDRLNAIRLYQLTGRMFPCSRAAAKAKLRLEELSSAGSAARATSG